MLYFAVLSRNLQCVRLLKWILTAMPGFILFGQDKPPGKALSHDSSGERKYEEDYLNAEFHVI